MFNNPEGKQWFYVRAPWNNPDGSSAWIRPFKSIAEVPEMGAAVAKGDYTKFTGKIAPMWNALGRLVFQVDEFGNKEKVGLVDVAKQSFTPISIAQALEAAKSHKAPIGSVLSAFGMPVSKGYPGGEFGKSIDEFKTRTQEERQDILDAVDQNIIDGDIDKAVELMVTGLYYRDADISARLMKFRQPLLKKFKSMSDRNKMMYLELLPGEDQVRLWDELEKEAGQ